MKLEMKCKVDSNTQILEEIKIYRPERTYIFHPNENYLIDMITIVSNVPRPEEFYSEYKLTPGQKTRAQIIIGKDEEFYDSIIREFQEIESMMSPLFGMKKVYWESAEYNVIPETEEEILNTKVTGWNSKYSSRPDIARIDKQILERMLDDRTKCQKLIDPMSFYREGTLDLDSRRFINAFYNFYFVIEGLYGNQKTKNKAIENEFKTSKGLTKAIEIVINDPTMLDAQMRNTITNLLTQKTNNLMLRGL